MKILLGIQARSNSTRLPEKIFKTIYDKPLLKWVVDACKDAVECYHQENKDDIVDVAVLYPTGDDKVLEWCIDNSVIAIHGSENDLIDRYISAATLVDADKVVRVTSDCWNLQYGLIADVMEALKIHDYASTTLVRSFEEGQDIQGCSREALRWFDLHQQDNREHPFVDFELNEIVRKQFEKAGFKITSIVNQRNVIFMHNSIDTQEDLDRANRIVEAAFKHAEQERERAKKS